MNSLAVFSLKGGTGKTTISASLGWILAEEGFRILLIDMDPQGHLSHFFKVHPRPDQSTLFGALIADQPLREAVVPTAYPNLEIIPAGAENWHLNEALIARPWREWKLKDALEAAQPLPYDLVLIDVGGNLSLVTYNALMAARVLLIPVLPDLFSYLSLKTLFAFLQETGQKYHVFFKMVWVLINKINQHRPLDRENRQALEMYYGKFLVPEVVREDAKLVQALREQVPVTRTAPQSTAARDLKKVARFIRMTMLGAPVP
ncbi:MAG: ParA family protein [Deltaproteobacteria bacterium]|nr:ParA family protein [Deltaproteobacteria bacterium]